MEGLLAFFLESTFLGMWIFGWDRLPKKIHLAAIWLAAIGTLLSAYFILAANAFMQHPVGYTLNGVRGRAELTSIMKVLTNSTALTAFFHTVPSAFLTAGALFAGVGAWIIFHNKDAEVAKPALKIGLVTVLITFVFVAVSGDTTARLMTKQQPMEMAAAEAVYTTKANIPFTYWSFRLMIGFGALAALISFLALWFVIIAVLWISYFVLEGFDFGVGVLLHVVAKNQSERRAVLTTLGPLWDGNEV